MGDLRADEARHNQQRIDQSIPQYFRFLFTWEVVPDKTQEQNSDVEARKYGNCSVPLNNQRVAAFRVVFEEDQSDCEDDGVCDHGQNDQKVKQKGRASHLQQMRNKIEFRAKQRETKDLKQSKEVKTKETEGQTKNNWRQVELKLETKGKQLKAK